MRRAEDEDEDSAYGALSVSEVIDCNIQILPLSRTRQQTYSSDLNIICADVKTA